MSKYGELMTDDEVECLAEIQSIRESIQLYMGMLSKATERFESLVNKRKRGKSGIRLVEVNDGHN